MFLKTLEKGDSKEEGIQISKQNTLKIFNTFSGSGSMAEFVLINCTHDFYLPFVKTLAEDFVVSVMVPMATEFC